jgi:hypothetical protein
MCSSTRKDVVDGWISQEALSVSVHSKGPEGWLIGVLYSFFICEAKNIATFGTRCNITVLIPQPAVKIRQSARVVPK